MYMTDISTALKTDAVAAREGVYVAKSLANTTVWDTLAKENPTAAVISTNDEASAAEKSREQIAELKTILHDGTILDLGCGYGRIAQYLLPERTFTEYIGLDSSYQMLTLFKQRYQSTEAEQGTPVTLVNADIHTLPLQDRVADNVIVAAVFLHNHKSVARQSIAEIKRVLKSDGLVLVYSSFPHKWTMMGLQGALYQAALSLRGNPKKNGPVRYYGRREVAGLFADFTDVTITPIGFAILPKRLIFLPGAVGRAYRIYIAKPINRGLKYVLPKALHRFFATHFDVMAKGVTIS